MIALVSFPPNGALTLRFVVRCLRKFVVSALVETADSTKDCSYIESA